MGTKNCKLCHSIFNSETSNICPNCLSTDGNTDFRKVRDFLYDHPGASALEIEKFTGVDRKKIKQYIDDGRISFK